MKRPLGAKLAPRERWKIFCPGMNLLAVLALTVTPRVKSGVATLQKIAASAKPAQVIAFLHQILTPALPVNQLKSMAI